MMLHAENVEESLIRAGNVRNLEQHGMLWECLILLKNQEKNEEYMERFIDICGYLFIMIMAIIAVVLGVIIYCTVQDIRDDISSMQIMILERDYCFSMT